MSNQLETKLQYFQSDYLTYSDLCALLPLGDNARYALIKRALKAGYLIRLRKGVYRRAQYLEKAKPHPFEMASFLCWPSYVSLESALSYHGLIPEAIYSTTCVTTRRAQTIENKFGFFNYLKLPAQNFFMGVLREELNGYIFYVASPWKAISDYIFCYKKDWVDMTPLVESLRMDLSALSSLDEKFADELIKFYHCKRIARFINGVKA